MPKIFAFILHKAGVVDDSAAELVVAAKKIDPAASPIAIVAGSGAELDTACKAVSANYAEVWKIGNDALAYPNAELVRQALVKVVSQGSIVLLPHEHFGIDMGPGLSVKLNAAFVSDVMDVTAVEGAKVTVARQEFGGQVSTHVRCDISAGAVINVRPGSFKVNGAAAVSGTIIDKSAEVGTLTAKRRYLETVVAEMGGVDITKQDVLVSVGRGIGDPENIKIAEELAVAMGGAVSCSRPVVDAKWLEKSRQVGTSGQTVKPKVYMACGISGAFQHVAGIKGNPLIIAINKNPKAPIFQVAEVGITADMLEFLPILTEKVRQSRGLAAKGGR